ncbi:MAG: IPT/TIG domain-containing protein [Terriglobales bacterium]
MAQSLFRSFHDRFEYLSVLLSAALIASLTACGGGGSSGTIQPAEDFELSASASSLTVQQLGSAVPYTVTVTPINGFNGTVAISFVNLPAGVTIFPAGPYTASPQTPLTVTFNASQTAALGNVTVTVQGSSGTLTHSTPVAVSVTAALSFELNVSPSTVNIGPNAQASAQITLVPGSNFGDSTIFITYPSAHIGNTGVDMNLSSEFLSAAQPTSTVTFQSLFEVQVENGIAVPITASVGSQVVNLPLTLNITNPAPACAGPSRSTTRRTDMDPTGVVYDPVHKLVFAAVDQTNSVEVYSASDAHTVASIPIPAARGLDISPDGSRILVGSQTRYLSWVDPNSLEVVEQVPMVSSLFNGGIPPTPLRPIILASGKVLVGGNGGAPFEWDPATNTWRDPTPAKFSPGDGAFRRSADHTKVVVATSFQSSLAIFDSASDSYGPVQDITTTAAALNSDGSRLGVIVSSPSIPGGNQVTLYDSTFNVLASYQLNSDVVPSDLIFSRDDSLLYVLTEGGYIVALHANDLSFAGAVTNQWTGGGPDYPPDIDETSMIFSPGNGARSTIFTDASAPCALGVDDLYNLSLNPLQGMLNSPSTTVLNAVGGIAFGSQVYFGAAPGSPQATPGTNLVYSPPNSVQVTTPAFAQAGAVNVTATNPNGTLGIALDGFSFGSNILAVTTTSGPASGGTSVEIDGYGLGFDKSQILVTVGGKTATVTNAFAGPGISPFPFPMDQVTFTTPAGAPGRADIVVTTPVGAATVSGGFHYLQNVQSFPISTTLAEVVYDPSRQRLYAADYATNKVYVFDLVAQKYLTPITVGNSPQGLALTPDFSTLVVSNGADSTVSIVDLSGVTPTKTVSVANIGLSDQCGPPIPYATVTTSKNQAVVAVTCPNVTVGEYIVIDLATQAIGCGASNGCAAMIAAYPQNLDFRLALAATPDGTKIFFLNGILDGLWDVPSDTFVSETAGDSGLGPCLSCPPFVQTAAAADGTTYSQFFSIIDPTLYLHAFMQDVDYLRTGTNDVNSVFGERLHPSGALLYFPRTSGFDIYDAHHGHIRRRVDLSLQIPVTFDAMALDETGSRVFLISASGLTVVDIADLPLSLGNIAPAQGSVSGGVSVRLRGSGFQNGALVLFGNAAAVVTFVDGSTLQVTTPVLPAGPTRITVTNPDGNLYFLDAAFTAD